MSMSIGEIICKALQEACGRDEQTAIDETRAIIKWGNENGQQNKRFIDWPKKAKVYSRSELAAKVHEVHSGKVADTAERLGVSTTTIYRIVNVKSGPAANNESYPIE